MELKGSKLVLVGGAGLVGSHTADSLLQEDVAQIVIYDNFVGGRAENLTQALRDPRVRIFELGGDITQTDILEAALEGADGVFHFAALGRLQCRQFPRNGFDINLRGTFNVIDACVRRGVKRLIFSSSTSIYGEAIPEPMAEEHPPKRLDLYAATKIAGEAMLRSFHYRYGLDFLGLRYSEVYGLRHHEGETSVLLNLLDSIDHGESLIPVGSSAAIDLIAAEDCARANLLAMQAQTTNNFYNISSGKPCSMRELVSLLLELTGTERTIHCSAVGAEGHAVDFVERAAREIGFRAKIDLREGLSRLIAGRAAQQDIGSPKARDGDADGGLRKKSKGVSSA